MRIVPGASGVLLVVDCLELFKALCPGVVDVLGEGDERSRRSGSDWGRHFEWRTGQWCKAQWLTLLLTAHVRHGLIWSSLPLPRDSSVY